MKDLKIKKKSPKEHLTKMTRKVLQIFKIVVLARVQDRGQALAPVPILDQDRDQGLTPNHQLQVQAQALDPPLNQIIQVLGLALGLVQVLAAAVVADLEAEVDQEAAQ